MQEIKKKAINITISFCPLHLFLTINLFKMFDSRYRIMSNGRRGGGGGKDKRTNEPKEFCFKISRLYFLQVYVYCFIPFVEY